MYFLACKVHQTGDEDLLKGLSGEDLRVINSIDDVFPSVTGLALALNLTRQGLINYEERELFFDTIKRAKLRVENAVEQRLFYNNPTGTIFNLKNNFNWKDSSDLNLGGQRDNPLLVDDAERHTRLAELLNKTGASGASGASGVEEGTAGEE